MELLYNPDSMPEAEVKATFVARQWLIDELVSMIKRQPDGAGVQHILVIAPRGMGKTTVLLMVKFAINDSALAKRWQAVKFPEERYGIYDLSDFWLEVLDLIGIDTNDEELRQRAKRLKVEYPDNEDLQEAALATIKDWRRKHRKRIVLLVDNIDMILEQINDERDNARLRDVLMNDGTMMMIGCAVSFFHEARSYDQPLYNFFKTYDLLNLRFEQMQELLRRRAQVDRVENFEEKLKENAGRLRVLEYFTGGNPRLVLMLYRVVKSNITEVQRGLTKLLDEVTPYFKSKVESLPPQLRKILDQIARESSRTNEGMTPTEIAEATRLPANQISAQLKRLSELGYVRAANLRGRSSFYTLSEPLYAIWHQMRFGRDARERMQWLVNFLKLWYGREEIGSESQRLESRFREHLSAGRMNEARDTLEHRRYIAYAMEGSPAEASTMDSVVRGYLAIKDTDTLKKDVLKTIKLENLSDETRMELYKAGYISKKKAIGAKPSAPVSKKARQQAEFAAATELGIAASEAGRLSESLQHFDQALEINSDNADAWYNRGIVLAKLGRYEEAVASYDRAVELNPDKDEAWNNRGNALEKSNRYEEALASYNRAVEINSDNARAWYNRGIALDDLERYEEAVASYDRAVEIKSDEQEDWNNRGIVLAKLSRYEEAIASYDRAIEIKPDYEAAWYNRALSYLKRFLVQVSTGETESAKNNWSEAVSSAKHIEESKWHIMAMRFLAEAAEAGHLGFVRQLIKESNLEEPLFPLARAIDYVLTGDEALIEKLSPEVRGIVKEVAATLNQAADQKGKTTTKSRVGKKPRTNKKPGSRSRIRKQLR